MGTDIRVQFTEPGEFATVSMHLSGQAAVEWARAFFPSGFPFLEEAHKAGVKILSIAACPPGNAAFYYPKTEEIRVDPGINWNAVVENCRKEHCRDRCSGCALAAIRPDTPGDAKAIMFFHEISHHIRREHGLKLLHLDPVRDQPFFEKEEDEANKYAAARFLEWKRSRSFVPDTMKGDTSKW